MDAFTEHPPLPEIFYLRPDVVQIAQDLIGKWLWTSREGQLTAGIIVETEAYAHQNDRACHAHQNRFTKRTQVMFGPGGHAYVYLCYGIHELFNIVTNQSGKADAVLVRAIAPTVGLPLMCQRRKHTKVKPTLTAGPGRLTQALGITRDLNTKALQSPSLWISEPPIPTPTPDLLAGPRVGIDYAGPDALLPWRFRQKDCPWCSAPNPPAQNTPASSRS
ncbi:MAG: DNA-3-methyladenine glycosylase [Bernardetiaceae bacterium]